MKPFLILLRICLLLLFITANSIKMIYQLATWEVSFIFDNKLYKETNSVAMGSLLGPMLANVFLYLILIKICWKIVPLCLSQWYLDSVLVTFLFFFYEHFPYGNHIISFGQGNFSDVFINFDKFIFFISKKNKYLKYNSFIVFFTMLISKLFILRSNS